MNGFSGPQKLRASNGIQEPVRATRILPIPSHDIAQLVSVVTGIKLQRTSDIKQKASGEHREAKIK
jgi:hypothetical protein